MPRHVAFLRAINVGGRVVKMDHLRRLFESVPLGNVETFIASGNVIFDAKGAGGAALEKKIERHLERALGYPVATFVRSAADVAAVAAHKPFAPAEYDAPLHAVYIGILRAEPSAAARKQVLALQDDLNALHLQGRELYWLCRRKMMESIVTMGKLEKTLGVPATFRNANTLRRLAVRYAGAMIDLL
jgi:uncharacterized protein (DUF1697 family)